MFGKEFSDSGFRTVVLERQSEGRLVGWGLTSRLGTRFMIKLYEPEPSTRV